MKSLEGSPHHSLGVLRSQGANHLNDEWPALGQHFSTGVKYLQDTVQLPGSDIWMWDRRQLDQGREQYRL